MYTVSLERRAPISDANICTIDRRTPLAPDFDRYKRSRLIAKQFRSQARRTLADYVPVTLKLRRRGNPYQASIIDSVAKFYSGRNSDARLDKRIYGGTGRDVVECCKQNIHAAGIH